MAVFSNPTPVTLQNFLNNVTDGGASESGRRDSCGTRIVLQQAASRI